jgi:hypothetical protein
MARVAAGAFGFLTLIQVLFEDMLISKHACQLSSRPPPGKENEHCTMECCGPELDDNACAPPGPNEPAPRSFAEQKWVLVLAGVIAYNERTPNGDIVVGIRGNNPHDWRRGGIRRREQADVPLAEPTA